MLLSRDAFREGVFKRDRNTCVVPLCGTPAVDAHHIIERRLWIDPTQFGGYFLDNGASVCDYHHQYGAETCEIMPQVLRQWCGIQRTLLPVGWDTTKIYDKWGVALLTPAPAAIKYPSTLYTPNSPQAEEDQQMHSWQPFLEQPLVITTKMDGSNVCLTHDRVAARNGLHADHCSFGLLKERFAQQYQALIPPGIQIFGEWLFAQHSIVYTDPLPNYLQIFSVYDEAQALFLSWPDVEAWAAKLEVPTTPVLAANITFTSEKAMDRAMTIMASEVVDAGHEGLVLRTRHPFPYGGFAGFTTHNGPKHWDVTFIAKYVRYDHNQCEGDWKRKKIVKNIEQA